MEYKKQLADLIKTVKANARATGGKLTNEEITRRLGKKSRTYLSDLLNPDGPNVTQSHILVFKQVFANELQGATLPAAPKDPLNRERAYIKTLVQRLASLEARLSNRDKKIILTEIEQDTILNLKELEGQ
ncbi:hypothetical protein AB6805_30530 [Chitinophaga sp. RCC_12]|uniref:hypothetical protein n=1 Tax=Chitinophaga sp. RCC_12 TaxID=3239226 RepID=UPI003525C62C